MGDFKKQMNNLAFKNPWRYGLTMGGIFAVVFFAITCTESAIGWNLYRHGIYGAITATVLSAAIFGFFMTWWTRIHSTPML